MTQERHSQYWQDQWGKNYLFNKGQLDNHMQKNKEELLQHIQKLVQNGSKT